MGNKMAKLSLSILSADFSALGDTLAMLGNGGADFIHMDVMDGRFVPNISFGSAVIESLSKKTELPFDVHLMVEEPGDALARYVTERTEYIVVHYEACRHLDRVLRGIKSLNVKCGVALNPSTHPAVLDYVLDLVDQILVMSVNPGFGGQAFIPGVLDKVRMYDSVRKELKLRYEIAVDGGVNVETAPSILEAGADILVVGSAVVGAADPSAALRTFREVANACAG
ncbi:MAG: ribulose-phosphate 3-epimerase [Clostridiales Family XIII bacterium]|jgi:ribulose-phosphate 3-epimerase|nr:ribulose-phosphate 3-epimerase [Clostridiales Family XIII bacterium]